MHGVSTLAGPSMLEQHAQGSAHVSETSPAAKQHALVQQPARCSGSAGEAAESSVVDDASDLSIFSCFGGVVGATLAWRPRLPGFAPAAAAAVSNDMPDLEGHLR